MDLHPTPFPGKRRPSANSVKKDGDRNKPSKEPLQTHSRPKRAFGVSRNPNIPIEKPLSKPSIAGIRKPLKPSGKSVKSLYKDPLLVAVTEKTPKNASNSSSQKTKADLKKSQHVSFQEPLPLAAEVVENLERSVKVEDVICTPISSIKPMVFETPYQSAENCSKCRLDKLESSSYWLAQIKLAESTGKHFVSATFFRLALECHAEPFLNLQKELKHYVVRHGGFSTDTLWGDLLHSYGLSNDQPIVGPCTLDKISIVLTEVEDSESNKGDEVKCKTHEDGCLQYNDIDNQPMDVSAEDPVKHLDTSTSELKEDLGKKETVDAKPTIDSSSDSLSKNKTSGRLAISHSGAKKSYTSNVSGKKLYGEKSNRGVSLSPGGLASNTKKQSPGGSAGKGGESLTKPRMGTDKARARISQSLQLRRNGEADAKITSSHLCENFNSDVGEDATSDQV